MRRRRAWLWVARLLLLPRIPVRSVPTLPRSLSLTVRQPTGRRCTNGPVPVKRNFRHALPSSKDRFASASNNSLVAGVRPVKPPLIHCHLPGPHPKNQKPRGQQPGSCGHRRRDYSHLPEQVEERDLPPEQCCCQECGAPFTPVGGTEDSTILEIEVKAHRRLIRRKRYRRACACPAPSELVTAPREPRVIPRSILGVSIWVQGSVGQVSVLPTHVSITGRSAEH